LYNEGLHNCYLSPNIIWVIKLREKWTEHVAQMGKWEVLIYVILVGYPERQRPVGKLKNRWEYNRIQEVLGRTKRLLSLIRHGPHRKRRVQQLFCCCMCIQCRGNVLPSLCPATIGGFLPSRYLATIRGYTYRHTD
jgi:hypothetical protein